MAWLTLRAELRQRWRAMAGLSVLLGLVGGVVLTAAAAGAWRTDTAYPRLLAWANAEAVIDPRLGSRRAAPGPEPHR